MTRLLQNSNKDTVMSKLEELIQKYCPDGVVYRPLGDVTTMQRGSSATKGVMQDGEIPVISGGRQPAFFCNQSNRTGETITVAGSGAGAGYVQYWNKPIFVCDAFSVKGGDGLTTKFVYYFLSSIQEKIYSTKKGGGVPHVHISSIDKFEIPIPPLPVQEEIVRVLDTFTDLQAVLQAELQKRLQQYNYYRDKLLAFEGRDDVAWKKLGEVCSVLRGKRLTKSQLSADGHYKVFHGGIDPIGFFDQYNRVGNTTMVINVGASAGTIGFSKDLFWSSDGCFCLSQSPVISGRFLYYYLQTKEPYLMSRVRRAGIPTLDGKVLEELIIPVPALTEQQKIIDILDRFDTLTTDLSAGLPAEIDARKKQYEFYRDKLLTFKRKEA